MARAVNAKTAEVKEHNDGHGHGLMIKLRTLLSHASFGGLSQLHHLLSALAETEEVSKFDLKLLGRLLKDHEKSRTAVEKCLTNHEPASDVEHGSNEASAESSSERESALTASMNEMGETTKAIGGIIADSFQVLGEPMTMEQKAAFQSGDLRLGAGVEREHPAPSPGTGTNGATRATAGATPKMGTDAALAKPPSLKRPRDKQPERTPPSPCSLHDLSGTAKRPASHSSPPACGTPASQSRAAPQSPGSEAGMTGYMDALKGNGNSPGVAVKANSDQAADSTSPSPRRTRSMRGTSTSTQPSTTGSSMQSAASNRRYTRTTHSKVDKAPATPDKSC